MNEEIENLQDYSLNIRLSNGENISGLVKYT